MRIATTLIVALIFCAQTAEADQYADAIAGFDTQQGLFDIHTRTDSPALFATLSAPDSDGHIDRLIYAKSLRSGLGSNPVGLDRGLGDSGQIVVLRRVGDRVVLEAENLSYRASSDNTFEQLAVTESFARSVLWSTPVVAQTSDGRLLVDLAGLLVSDSMGISQALQRAGQGQFSVDTSRSMVDGEQLAFVDNVELEATLTFASRNPGDEVWATTPDGRLLSLTTHHSFMRLPDDDYAIRFSDPRAAAIDIDYYDFSQPLDQPLVQRLARRFRLQKSNPTAALSPVVSPIVFYIDRGAPEQIRQALLDGAGWWAAAFEAAGFQDGYQVKLLPEGAHPLDIRYNVVQWVHRQTRGWSYGGGVADPRTGEMLKGHVILGSQRVRQDRMIFEGLAGRQNTGSGNPDDPIEMSLARIRQLAAHEVGHSLGFQHNMGASADDRASVMDYPAPLVTVEDDALDFSSVYTTEIGPWDKFTVAWLYGEFAPGTDEDAALGQMIEEVYTSGLHYVADQHARPVSSAHPRGSLWDNGSDPVASLNNTLAVREIALQQFGRGVIGTEQSLSDLRTVFAPIYLYHRYQVLAAAKVVGGIEFDYALNDADSIVAPVSSDRQRDAIDAIVATLSPTVLRIPEATAQAMLPPMYGREPVMGRERFDGQIGPMFDVAYATGAAAKLTLGALLHEARLGRLQQMHASDTDYPSVASVFEKVRGAVYMEADATPAQTAVQSEYLNRLMQLHSSNSAPIPVKAAAENELRSLASLFSSRRVLRGLDAATRTWQTTRVGAYLDGSLPSSELADASVEIPPGSPIGSTCWHCDSASLIQ